MRNFTLLVFFASLFSIGIATAQKRAVMTKVTATWCTRCGMYGWDFMESLKSDYEQSSSEALVLGVHFSGNLQNPTAQWFASNLQITGQPQFFVSNENYFVTSANWEAKLDEVKEGVSEFVNNEMSIADATILTSDVLDENGNLNIDIQVTQEDTPDDLFLGVYIYENNVMDVQAARSGIVSHPNVLREAVTAENFGDQIADAGAQGSASQIYSYSWTPNPDYDLDNVGVLAIVWRKQGDIYVLDHSTAISNFASVTSDVEELDPSLFSITQDIGSIYVQTDNANLYNVDLYNSAGQLIKQSTFSNRINIPSSYLIPGIYILTLTDGDKRLTHKIHVN